ncbi:MAG: LysR family transcriptional regulator [Planctomycetaceae bacterium]|nr:LysR family transcriptional regulator [Planctomycetaceae bacterium]
MLLRNAEIFCDIVACHSFSKAAEARNLSQPAISQALQQLEEYLGTTLIDRSKRPFHLTSAGEAYYEGCRKLFDGFRRLEDNVQQLGDRVTGRLRIASIYSVGLLQMAAFVTRFQTEYPDVETSIEYLHPDQVYDRLSRDEADLGLVSFPRDGGDFSCIPWQEQELGLVITPEHPLADQELAKWEDLAGETFVGFTSDLRIRREIDRRLKQAKVSVTVVHTFDNIENIKRAVEIGAGVSILPLPTVRREVEHGFLKALPLEDRSFYRPLGIIHKRHKHLSNAAEKFVELLHDEVPADDGALVPVGMSGAR